MTRRSRLCKDLEEEFSGQREIASAKALRQKQRGWCVWEATGEPVQGEGGGSHGMLCGMKSEKSAGKEVEFFSRCSGSHWRLLGKDGGSHYLIHVLKGSLWLLGGCRSWNHLGS